MINMKTKRKYRYFEHIFKFGIKFFLKYEKTLKFIFEKKIAITRSRGSPVTVGLSRQLPIAFRLIANSQSTTSFQV